MEAMEGDFSERWRNESAYSFFAALGANSIGVVKGWEADRLSA